MEFRVEFMNLNKALLVMFIDHFCRKACKPALGTATASQ
jgi:hypothetical protein